MDKLTHLIKYEVRMNNWKTLKLGRQGTRISHLKFVDDLLLFGEATKKQMECVMRTLNMFCNMSGQEVSQEKTGFMFSKNVNRNMQNKLANLYGYWITNNLGKYLGVPLSGKMLIRNDFHYLVDQIATKLASWKKNNLSFAGRITLAKRAIEVMPLYPMMTNKLPKAIIEEIHSMQHKFIWGDTEEQRKIHAVGWNTLTKPKRHNGLWLRNPKSLNTTCMMKLGWKIATNAKDML